MIRMKPLKWQMRSSLPMQDRLSRRAHQWKFTETRKPLLPPSVLENADDFRTFTQAEGADKIIVRPEFVKISKLDEVEKFRTSVSQGVVERVSFRGDNLELQVRVNNSVVTARRSLEKADVREGEIVNVFLYRIFALKGDSVQLIENEAVRDDFVII